MVPDAKLVMISSLYQHFLSLFAGVVATIVPICDKSARPHQNCRTNMRRMLSEESSFISSLNLRKTSRVQGLGTHFSFVIKLHFNLLTNYTLIC